MPKVLNRPPNRKNGKQSAQNRLDSSDDCPNSLTILRQTATIGKIRLAYQAIQTKWLLGWHKDCLME